MTVPRLAQNDPLHAACVAYEEARHVFVRTPRTDRAFHLKALIMDEAHDRLVTLLTLHGSVFHHGGLAWWIEDGDLHRGKVESFRVPRQGETR